MLTKLSLLDHCDYFYVFFYNLIVHCFCRDVKDGRFRYEKPKDYSIPQDATRNSLPFVLHLLNIQKASLFISDNKLNIPLIIPLWISIILDDTDDMHVIHKEV